MRNENYLSQRTHSAKKQGKNLTKIFAPSQICAYVLILLVLNLTTFAQTEMPPTPSAPRSAKIPAVVEKKLPNGLKVAVVERKNVPLVTVQLLINSGANAEESEQAGLANMTASMLTKGTKTRSATQIAEQMEFLGGSINSGAGWNTSVVTISVMSDKLDAALAILSDVVLNPKFDQKELDLLKSQALDGLTNNLKQPGFLANYVASKYSFDEHPAGGTPESLNAITKKDIVDFKKRQYEPYNAVLIFSGDITAIKAKTLATKYFGVWKSPKIFVIDKVATMEEEPDPRDVSTNESIQSTPLVKRMLVVDLPNSGQASVNYLKSLNVGRIGFDKDNYEKTSSIYFPASVLNSVLGGGYSSRLNQEIRIKRGLSYGAGSIFSWRNNSTNFGTRTQTKNESAPEVAELVFAEIERLINSSVPAGELAPRKLVLTGDFGRDLETTGGLAQQLADLYSFSLPISELSSYMQNVQGVTDAQIKDFAVKNLKGGDLIIVGDYSVFKDDLAKRFPKMKIEVIKADELDLNTDNLQKAK